MSDDQQPASGRMDEDLDVHKRGERASGDVSIGMIRRPVFAMSELFRGLSLASAEAFGALSEALVAATDDEAGLRTFADGLAESNRRYLDSVSTTSRRFVDQVTPRTRAEPAADPIDYDRLAKLVAAELRKGDTGAA